jgi:hypothetical protein
MHFLTVLLLHSTAPTCFDALRHHQGASVFLMSYFKYYVIQWWIKL